MIEQWMSIGASCRGVIDWSTVHVYSPDDKQIGPIIFFTIFDGAVLGLWRR